MKTLFWPIILVIASIPLFGANEWLYYKFFPWVYDHQSKEWMYLSGSADGKIYAYRANTKQWVEFEVSEETEVGSKAFDPNNPSDTLTLDINSTVKLDMIWVEPGIFMMGSPTTEAGRGDDETQHEVILTEGFYLGKYEVTQAQYEAVMTGNTNSLSADPSQYKGGNRPVERVSWEDAEVFLYRLNEQQAGNLPAGWAYVLPTESQWEYACRAGTTTAYSWGESITSSDANYDSDAYIHQTVNVGNYAANPWGFFDMHGNVYEWTADWYNEVYPTGNPVIDPLGPTLGWTRVIRGGSWDLGNASTLRSANRQYAPRNVYDLRPVRWYNLGFRIALKKTN